jgi:hypothetical protein
MQTNPGKPKLKLVDEYAKARKSRFFLAIFLLTLRMHSEKR